VALDARASLEVFLDTIWKPPPGHEGDFHVYVASLKRDTGEFRKSFYLWPSKRKYAVQHTLAKAAMGLEVYINPLLWKKASLERHDILGSWCLWADFDGTAPDEWAETPNDHASGQPGAAPGPPSLRVQTSEGRHEHAYWLLDELATNLEWIENTNRSIAYSLEADVSGWDYTQLLRPPGTTNHKRQNSVILIANDDITYNSDAFRNTAPVADTLFDTVTDADLVDYADVLAKYTFSDDNLELLKMPLQEVTKLADGRSSAMMRIAYYCAELGMTEVEIFSILHHLDDKWEKFKHRKNQKKCLINIVNKAKFRYPEAVEQINGDTWLTVSEEPERNPRAVFGFKDFLKSDYKIEWLVDRLIAEKTVGVIASAPGKGKTQFLLNLGMHCVLGKPFVGYNVTKPHKVMFFSLEMGPELLHEFIKQMAPAYTEEEHEKLQTDFLLLPAGMQMLLKKMPNGDPGQGRIFVEEMIEEYKPDAIYIDSLARVVPGKFDDEDIIELFAYFSRLRAKFGISVCIIHHNRKAQGDNKRPKNLEDIYGSQYIGGEVDYAITLFPEMPDNSILQVSEVKNRLAAQRPPFYVARTDHLQFEVTEFKGGVVIDGNRFLAGALNAPLSPGHKDNPFT
jgi:hypothetical protein